MKTFLLHVKPFLYFYSKPFLFFFIFYFIFFYKSIAYMTTTHGTVTYTTYKSITCTSYGTVAYITYRNKD